MTARKKTNPLLWMLATSLFYGCYNDVAEDLYPSAQSGNCDTMNITYTAVIKPIIQTKCATSGCHLGAMPTGYDLSTHAGLAVVANNGRLVMAIEHTGPSPMPQGAPKLDDCSITKIKKWVASGTPNN